jgi:hypothetical protein
MATGANTLIHDKTLYLRGLLASGVSDPLGTGTRVSGIGFVMTNFPEREASYPLITIRLEPKSSQTLGVFSNVSKIDLTAEVQIYCKNAKQRDQLTDSVVEALRVNDSGCTVNNLVGFDLQRSTTIDEPGKDGLHRRILEFGYFFVTGS